MAIYRHLTVFRIVILYVLLASLWVLFSGYAIDQIFSSRDELLQASTLMGWLFVLVTALIFYGLLTLNNLQNRTSAEELQQEHEQRLQAQSLLSNIINASDESIFAKDLEGRYLMCNPRAELIFGKPRDQVLGKDDSELFTVEHARILMENDQQAISKNKIITYEEEVETAQGRKLFLSSKGPLQDNSGTIIGVFGIARDITAHRQTTRDLKKSETRLRVLIDTLPDLVWLKDPDGYYLACNALFEKLYAAKESEIQGKTDYDFVEKPLADMFRANDQAAIDAGGPRTNEEWVVFADDGHEALLETTKTPVIDPGGKLIGVLGIGHDITTKRRIRQRLQALTDDLARAQSIASIGSWSYQVVDAQIEWSEEMFRIFGRDRQLDGLDYNSIVSWTHPEDRERHYDYLQRMLALKPDDQIELLQYRLYRPDGEVRWVEANVECDFDDMGNPLKFYGTLQDITDRKQTAGQLLESEQRLRLFFKHAPTSLAMFDLDMCYLAVSERWITDFHLEGEELIGRCHYEVFPDLEEEWHAAHREGLAGKVVTKEQDIYPNPDGSLTWYRWEVHPWRDASGQVGGIVTLLEDITLRKSTEDRLRLAASVFRNTAEAVVMTDVNVNIIEVNDAFTRITGYTREDVLGCNPSLLKSGLHDRAFYQTMWQSINTTGQWRGELKNRHKDGSLIPIWQNISSVSDDSGQLTHYISVFSDISQIKHSQEKLDHLAHHDALTDLPNRLLLNERLEQAIRNADRHQKQFAVVMLDLDHFKHINDSLGHHVGDELLKVVSANLLTCTRENDTIARIGGDEFVLLLEDMQQADRIGNWAEKLLELFNSPIETEGHELQISASIGICFYPEDGTQPETLLRNADAAMYRAKENGRNNYQLYTLQLTEDVVERLTIVNNLRFALQKQQLYLVYQPQVDLKTGQLIGAEALIRWSHPDMGPISPARFIPLAEDSGAIHPIGEWVLNTVCQQAAAWRDGGIDFGRVAVNIAGPQLQRGDLPTLVQNALSNSKLPAQYLELEVTEGFIMLQADSTIAQLNEIREMGVMLSIDDFGTGYSSLSYLKKLPINKIKIDQGFVRDIPDDANDMAISNAVIALGNSLGLTVIAEGVETEIQANFLRGAGCQEGQGYLYSRPIPAEEFARFSHRKRQSRSALDSQPQG